MMGSPCHAAGRARSRKLVEACRSLVAGGLQRVAAGCAAPAQDSRRRLPNCVLRCHLRSVHFAVTHRNDPEIAIQKRIELLDHPDQSVSIRDPGRIRRRIHRHCQNGFPTLGKGSLRTRSFHSFQQRDDLGDQLTRSLDRPQGGLLGGLRVRQALQLSTLEQSTPQGTRMVNRATGFAERRARLQEVALSAFPFQFQPECRQRSGGIDRLHLHGMEQDTITAHPTRRAEAGCRGGIRGSHR